MTDAERRSHEIDQDRRAVEIAALLALLPLLAAAERHAAQAIRIGVDPVTTASAVLSGNPAIHQPGIGTVLAAAALSARIIGHLRTQATAAEFRTGQAVPLDAVRQVVRSVPNLLTPDRQHAPAVRQLLERAGGVVPAQRRFDLALDRVVPVVRNIEQRVGARLARISVQGPALPYRPPPGAHTPMAIADAMRESRLAFEKVGIGTRTTQYVEDRWPTAGQVNTASNAEAIVEAIVGEEYESGRRAGAGAGTSMWGWTWSALIDGRQCKYCRKLHGTTAPIDDPLWQQFGPMLHFRCRCSRLERFVREGSAPPPIRRPNLSDPDIIAAVQMRRSLGQWWQQLPDSL